MAYKIRNIYKESRGIGLMTFRFRLLSYSAACALLIIHNIENNFPFDFLDYLLLACLIIMPHVFLYRFVRSGKRYGQLTHDTTYDFFFAGMFSAAMNFAIVPSFVFSLGATTNYLASRGFHKLYRLFLLPLGFIFAIIIDDQPFHFETSRLILLLSLAYCVAHYVINAYILYFANLELKRQNDEIEKQQAEILSQAEELKALNESLKNLNTGLEEKIHQRTKELERKNHKLEEYAFMNAHKLRAPVATILGLIQLLDYHKGHEETREIIEGLRKTSAELDSAIKGIRARLEEEH